MNYSSKPWLKFYDPWVVKEISKSDLTFKDCADATLKNFPDRPAFHFFDLTWTYRELMDKADRFAHALGMLTHRNMVAMVEELETWIGLNKGEDVILCPFPMYHVGGACSHCSVFFDGFHANTCT